MVLKDLIYDLLTDIYLRMRFMAGVWKWEWHCVPTAVGAVKNMERTGFLWKDDPKSRIESPVTEGKSLRRPPWEGSEREDMRWMEYGSGFWETF